MPTKVSKRLIKSVSASKLTQGGATTGQVLTWNGSAYVPADLPQVNSQLKSGADGTELYRGTVGENVHQYVNLNTTYVPGLSSLFTRGIPRFFYAKIYGSQAQVYLSRGPSSVSADSTHTVLFNGRYYQMYLFASSGNNASFTKQELLSPDDSGNIIVHHVSPGWGNSTCIVTLSAYDV